MALTDFLTQIADSIRSKDGTTESIPAIDFPQRILDIPSGSGSAVDFAFGTVTPTADTQTIEIEHGLGHKPTLFCLYAIDGIQAINSSTCSCIRNDYGDLGDGCYSSARMYNGIISQSYLDKRISTANETKCTFITGYNTHYFRSGWTFYWIAR